MSNCVESFKEFVRRILRCLIELKTVRSKIGELRGV